MALLPMLSLSIGASIAKYMVKEWLGDGLPNTLAGDVIDETKKKLQGWLTSETPQDPVEQVGRQVARRMIPFFEGETRTLSKEDRAAVVIAVAETLERAKIRADLLIQKRLDADALLRDILQSPANYLRTLGPLLIPPAERLLAESCRELVSIGANLSGFEVARTRQSLANDDEILEGLARLLQQPAKAAAHFEQQYRKALIDELDHFEQFGISYADDIGRRQSLDIAHIMLRMEQLHERDDAFLSMKQIRGEAAIFSDEKQGYDRESPRISGFAYRVLERTRRLVVQGRAGSGKSTFLRWIAIRAAKQDFPAELAEWNDYVPFFIQLRNYVNAEFPAPEAFLQYLAPMLQGKMPPGWVHDLLDQGRALVLIDGIDELPAEERPAMLARVQDLVRDSSIFTRYLFTSRPAALNAEE